MRFELAKVFNVQAAQLAVMKKPELFDLLEEKKKALNAVWPVPKSAFFVVLALFAEHGVASGLHGRGEDLPRRLMRSGQTVALSVKLQCVARDGDGARLYEPSWPLEFDRVRCGDRTSLVGTFAVDNSPSLAELSDVRLGQVGVSFVALSLFTRCITPFRSLSGKRVRRALHTSWLQTRRGGM
jgi:hypothetical protein